MSKRTNDSLAWHGETQARQIGHRCEDDPDLGWGLFGSAISSCYEDDEGRFWVTNDEYTSQVRYCPYCGAKAPTQTGAGYK